MKQIKVNVFSLTELPEAVREKVTEKHRYINVGDNHWYQRLFEDFCQFCSTIGVQVNPEKIYFRGFYSQGDGSCFYAKIDLLKMITATREEQWRDYAPNEKPRLSPCNVHRFIVSMLEKGIMDYSIRIDNSTFRSYSVKVEAEFDYSYHRRKAYPRIAEQLEGLERWLTTTADRLNKLLYSWLQREYEYQTSDVAVRETITGNNYLFTENGRKADYLESLAIA